MIFIDLFSQYKNYSTLNILLEIIAVIFGICSVILVIRKNIFGYPTGIISTGIYTYLNFSWGLFGELFINFYYTIMSVYGWYLWKNTHQMNENFKISRININEYLNIFILFIFSFFFFLIVYFFKNNYFIPIQTDLVFNFQYIDFIDVFSTTIFIIGMYLMAKLKIEHWLFWIIGDFICIPLYHFKGYDFTALQFLIFLCLAIFGYLRWVKNN
jgi:nicotinamide mononucleotide transporter